jgi:hypothetical protein
LFFARIIKSAKEMPAGERLLSLRNYMKLYVFLFEIFLRNPGERNIFEHG